MAEDSSHAGTIVRDLVAGATAAVAAVGVVHPVDTLKTIIQVQQKTFRVKQKTLIASILSSSSGATCTKGSAAASAVRLTIFERLKKSVTPYFKATSRTAGYAACSCLAGLVNVPFESTKQRLQSGLYRNALECIADGWRNRGLRSLYIGWSATVARDLPFTIIELTVYERLKEFWKLKKKLNGSNAHVVTPREGMVIGCLAAGLGGFVTCPLDVIKTRVMTSPYSVNGLPMRNIRLVVQDIVRNDGLSGFFRGAVPRVAQLSLMGSIFFASFETCKNIWSQLIVAFVAGYFLGERGKKKKSPKYSLVPPTLNHISEYSAVRSGGTVRTCKEDCKLVLCVRTDLKMGKGKIAAQCGHATLGAYQDTLRSNPGYLWKWEADGQPKIALQVPSLGEMKTLERKARNLGIVAHTVIDAGKTQVAPGSITVLSLGPAPVSLIDKVTKHLKTTIIERFCNMYLKYKDMWDMKTNQMGCHFAVCVIDW
eukprot:jgi/Galph1/5540/GphlegSOOS_G4181.1